MSLSQDVVTESRCCSWLCVPCPPVFWFRLRAIDRMSILLSSYHLVGLVIKASASRAEGPGFESRLRRGQVIPVT